MSLVLKAKTEKYEEKKQLVDPQKGHFWVWNKNLIKMFSLYFSYVLALKTIDVQMLFFDGTK